MRSLIEMSEKDIDALTEGCETDALVADAMGITPDKWNPPCAKYHQTDEAEFDSLYGWSGFCYTCKKLIRQVNGEPERYSSDISAAWLVVEKMRLCVRPSVISGKWVCGRFMRVYLNGKIEIENETTDTRPELAICKAALKAVRAQRLREVE